MLLMHTKARAFGQAINMIKVLFNFFFSLRSFVSFTPFNLHAAEAMCVGDYSIRCDKKFKCETFVIGKINLDSKIHYMLAI